MGVLALCASQWENIRYEQCAIDVHDAVVSYLQVRYPKMPHFGFVFFRSSICGRVRKICPDRGNGDQCAYPLFLAIAVCSEDIENQQ